MQTWEEYFAALAGCLAQMPAAEREETLTYYREYAQEGGLLDGEQLREHFGPPEVLAAQILEDRTGKRNGAQTAAAAHTPAGMPLWAAVLLGVVVFLALVAVLLRALHPGSDTPQPVPTEAAPAASQLAGTEPAAPGSDASADTLPQSYDGPVDPFTDVCIDVVAADIQVETGTDYGLRYDLSAGETVRRMGVEGGTLYLVSDSRNDQVKGGQVWITVPEDADLGELRLSCVQGDVVVPDIICRGLTVDNTAGDAMLDCVAAEDVTADTTAGSLRFGGSCRTLRGDTTMGNLECTGTAESVSLDTIAGNVTVSGTVTAEIRAGTTSGNITVTAADPAGSADGPRIRYNGQEVDGGSWSGQGSGCALDLSTLSGDISIQTP